MKNKKASLALLLCFSLLFGCCGEKGVNETKESDSFEIVSIKILYENQKDYVDKPIIISGFLTNQGKNYFQDLRVIIKDSLDNYVSVKPWVPIEVPPSKDLSATRPMVLSDYLGKEVKFKGFLRLDKEDIIKDSEFFFEVGEAAIIKG